MYNKFKKLISFILIFYMAISCVNIRDVMAVTSMEEKITLKIENSSNDEDMYVFNDYVILEHMQLIT